jgi:hypothetical protein
LFFLFLLFIIRLEFIKSLFPSLLKQTTNEINNFFFNKIILITLKRRFNLENIEGLLVFNFQLDFCVHRAFKHPLKKRRENIQNKVTYSEDLKKYRHTE